MSNSPECQLQPEVEARLLQTPQRAGALWLGDFQPLDAIAGEARYGLSLWQEAHSGLLRSAGPYDTDRSTVEVVLESLEEAILTSEPKVRPCRPQTVAVRPELVQALGPPLSRLGIQVTALPDPEALLPVFREIEDSLFGPTLTYLRPPGVTVEQVRRLFAEARALWDLAPWEQGIDDQLLFQVEGLTPGLSFSVMGAADIERGLSIYLDQAAVLALANQNQDLIEASNLISFTYSCVEDIPSELMDEIEEHDFPLVEESDLVPLVLCPHGGMPGPAEHALLQDLLELLRLLSERADYPHGLRPGARLVVEMADGRQVAVHLADLFEVGERGLNRKERRKKARRMVRMASR